MTKSILVTLVLAMGSAFAQSPPQTPPTPPPTEKGNESLQQGGDERPWAAGVPADKQALALKLFQDGNSQLNDGIFTKAVELYREALKSWDHPAIHYNMALALMTVSYT